MHPKMESIDMCGMVDRSRQKLVERVGRSYSLARGCFSGKFVQHGEMKRGSKSWITTARGGKRSALVDYRLEHRYAMLVTSPTCFYAISLADVSIFFLSIFLCGDEAMVDWQNYSFYCLRSSSYQLGKQRGDGINKFYIPKRISTRSS